MRFLTLFVLLFCSVVAHANTAEMKKLVQLTNGNIYGGRVPDGYRSEKLQSAPMNANLKSYLEKKTEQKKKDWRQFVFRSGEYSRLSTEARRQVAYNPWKELGVKYILEIEEVYAIYKGRKLIGYFIEITDHVQAAIYQDGAWINTFFNSELVLAQAFDEPA